MAQVLALPDVEPGRAADGVSARLAHLAALELVVWQELARPLLDCEQVALQAVVVWQELAGTLLDREQVALQPLAPSVADAELAHELTRSRKNVSQDRAKQGMRRRRKRHTCCIIPMIFVTVTLFSFCASSMMAWLFAMSIRYVMTSL